MQSTSPLFTVPTYNKGVVEALVQQGERAVALNKKLVEIHLDAWKGALDAGVAAQGQVVEALRSAVPASAESEKTSTSSKA